MTCRTQVNKDGDTAELSTPVVRTGPGEPYFNDYEPEPTDDCGLGLYILLAVALGGPLVAGIILGLIV